MVGPHQIYEHQGWLNGLAFRSGDHNKVTCLNPLNILILSCLYTKTKIILHDSHEQKRFFSLNEQGLITESMDHASATSSDWQLGQIGFLPIPLNCSPHSLQR